MSPFFPSFILALGGFLFGLSVWFGSGSGCLLGVFGLFFFFVGVCLSLSWSSCVFLLCLGPSVLSLLSILVSVILELLI